MSKLYTLKLTDRELWHLRESYEASFTERESKNDAERSLSEKLENLAAKRAKSEKKRPLPCP